MEGEEYWPKLEASVSSSLEEPLAVASQHEHEPATKTYSGIFSLYR